MTKKTKTTIKKGMPSNWRKLVAEEYETDNKPIKPQRLTDLIGGKIRDVDAISEFLTYVQRVKRKHSEKLNRLKTLV